jgi:murein DD-endopeptidase MepM/ murein hydrolase activator NlpD
MPFRLRYPVDNPLITQYFLERPQVYSRFNLPGHEGIDFGVPVGAPVYAAADGTVDAVETDPNKHAYGKYIRLRHKTPDGTFTTLYGHLSDITVTKDQKVSAGERIGISGSTGFSDGPHLHLSLKMPGVAARGLTRYDDLINNRQNVLFSDDFLDPAYFFDPPPPRQSTRPRSPLPFAPLFAPAPPDAPAQPQPNPAATPPQPIGVRETIPPAPVAPEPTPPVMPVQPPITVVVDTVDTGPIQRPDHPLRGLHGDNAAHWMLQHGVRGWAVETVYANGDLSTLRPVDFSAHEAAGIRVLVRWNYSYASSDGGLGTFPARARHSEFIRWCVSSIKASRGVWGHIIGNEPNRAAERPSWDEPITADDVVKVYNGVWNALPQAVRASPPAIDPTNIETADPREYWRSIVSRIAGAEFFALHAYSYGSDQPPDSSDRFNPPLSWQYHSFRMYEPLANDLYSQPALMKYRRRPLIITETNPLYLRGSNLTQPGWDDDAHGWVQRVFEHVARWNQSPGAQYVHGVCLYRLEGGADPWRIFDKGPILEALKVGGEVAR